MIKNDIFRGCGTALVTPFSADGRVDYQAYRRFVERQVTSGIDFLVPLGTTAETPCLSLEEKRELLKITREQAPAAPLLVGAGTNSLSGTLSNIEALSDCGVDGFLIVTPYYNKPQQAGLIAYFEAVADASPKPIVLYNVPGRTGVNLETATTLALAKHPNIIAIKEASGRYAQISNVIAGGMSVLSGNDDETLSLMSTGADGVISVVSNVAPGQMVKMVHALQSGDIALARELHHSLMPLAKALFVESNPVPAKAALSILGLCGDSMRLPLVPASNSTRELLSSLLKDYEL